MKKLYIMVLATIVLATGCTDKNSTEENKSSNNTADISENQETTVSETEYFDIEAYSFENVDTSELEYKTLALDASYNYEQEESAMEGAAVSAVYRNKDDNKKVVILYSGPQKDIDTSDRTDSMDSVMNDTVVTLQQVSDSAQYSAWWTSGDNKYLIDTFNLAYEDFLHILEDCLSQSGEGKE